MRLLAVAILLAAAATVEAATLNVPAQYTTVQAAIDAANAGDVVVVAQGTYKERLRFKGKAITVRSTDPADLAVVAATCLDGDAQGTVVTFDLGETSSAVLQGFTITNGSARQGGGIYCQQARPTITGNRIVGNYARYGGGVYCEQQSGATLTHNLICRNSADSGGGVYCYYAAPTLTGNTIARNEAKYRGGGVYCDSASPTLKNNIVALSTNSGGLQCRSTAEQPVITYCDFYGNTGGNFITCTDPTGSDGNVAVNPRFANPGADDYRLRSPGGRWNGSAWVQDTVASGCLDAGDPATDFANEPAPNGGRINLGFDGNTAYASKSVPTVVAWTPRGDTVGWKIPVTVTFSTLMRHSSVERCFVLAPDAGGAAVAGTFSWTGRQVTFTPAAPLARGTKYRATVKARACSREGIALGQAFSWTYTTHPDSAVLALTATAAGTAQGAAVTVNLTSAATVQTSILNLAGRVVATLPEQACDAGTTTLLWSGRSRQGTLVPGGTYLLRVTARGADGTQSSALASCSLRR